MAVTQVGTPAATVITTTNGTNTPALSWGTGQNRTTGNILVLAVTASAATSITSPVPHPDGLLARRRGTLPPHMLTPGFSGSRYQRRRGAVDLGCHHRGDALRIHPI